MKIAITHTTALSRFGEGTRGLARALATGAPLPGVPAEQPLANPRARKMMSRAAYLAARCLTTLLHETGWTDRERVGYFLGVGASGGSLEDVTGLLERGVAACNPLLAFQLMNNFTMCHGAILEGVGGPNAALFSRGAGTIEAIGEAVHAIRSGDCEHAVAGGADEASHPVTVAELTRDGFIGRGLAPADGAALIALAATSDRDAILVEGCAHASGRGRSIGDALDDALARAAAAQTSHGTPDDAFAPADDAPARAAGERPSGERGDDAPARAAGERPSGERNDDAPARAAIPHDITDVVIAPWGPPAADALRSFVAARFPAASVLDVSLLGEALAASAALAVCAAVDLLSTKRGRIVVLSIGVDGDPGIVLLSRGAA